MASLSIQCFEKENRSGIDEGIRNNPTIYGRSKEKALVLSYTRGMIADAVVWMYRRDVEVADILIKHQDFE
jgi:hypothetical protein